MMKLKLYMKILFIYVKGKKDNISEFINRDEIENKYPTKAESS